MLCTSQHQVKKHTMEMASNHGYFLIALKIHTYELWIGIIFFFVVILFRQIKAILWFYNYLGINHKRDIYRNMGLETRWKQIDKFVYIPLINLKHWGHVIRSQNWTNWSTLPGSKILVSIQSWTNYNIL
jgi:hypothetical protein